MVGIAISPGTLTTAGPDIGFGSGIEVEAPAPILTSGPAISFITAEAVAALQSTPDSVRARVHDEDGVFICHLPHANGLKWLDEHNSLGSGSIDALRFDGLEDEHPTVWDPGNQVIISVGELDVFRLVLDAEGGYQLDDAGQRTDTLAGLGALGILNSGMVYPEYGFRPEATEERSFDYGSNPAIGGWFVASEWKTPVGVPVRKSWRWTYKKRHLPKGWPDKKAQWIWWKNPDTTSVPDETCYFSSSFTLAAASRVRFLVCGDDTLEFQVDGEVRATVGPGGWKKPTRVVLVLSAGVHYVAAKVQNAGSSSGAANRSGFLCTIARMNSDGDVVAVIRRSNPQHWTVRRQLTHAPGWFPAQILARLVYEQAARGCAGHAGISYGFTTNADSHGISWTIRQEMALTVGTQGTDWLQQLVETGMDVAMTPGLVLNAWRQRGTDRSGYVRITKSSAESRSQPPGIRNVLYAKSKTGWAGTSDATSVTSRGRRETMVTLGSSRSTAQTGVAINGLLPDLADPPPTVEVHLPGTEGPQPYRDFDVADWIGYKPAGATTWGRYRVMSIGGEVTDAGYPDWTLQLYADPL